MRRFVGWRGILIGKWSAVVRDVENRLPEIVVVKEEVDSAVLVELVVGVLDQLFDRTPLVLLGDETYHRLPGIESVELGVGREHGLEQTLCPSRNTVQPVIAPHGHRVAVDRSPLRQEI